MPSHSKDMEQTFWHAVETRDRSFDGRFYYGVLTTGVYCRPSCGARRPLRENVRFYGTPAEAERDGLRACLRCRPTEDADARMRELCRYIEAHADERLTLEQLAAHTGMSRFHLQRTFKATIGVSPRDYQEAFRMARLKKGLRESRGVADAVYEAGFGSSSRVYERADAKLGMTPGEYRAGGRGVEISYARFQTALGPMLIGATDRGICFLQFGASLADLRREFPHAEVNETESHSPQLKQWSRAIGRFLEGDFPLAPSGTPFQMQVWNFLRTIPRGETRTYREIAEGIGRPSAVRAVARACASNRVAVLIPCHRVIRNDGSMGGYRWGDGRKRALLEREGARASM
jgi:AraC family transcriptional regulator, regulatory protein of adaptative response / methylated-DNA-[protein]-cysteine methyltransferase